MGECFWKDVAFAELKKGHLYVLMNVVYFSEQEHFWKPMQDKFHIIF